MTFVAIVLSLALDKLLDRMESWRRFGWFEALVEGRRTRAGEGPWSGPVAAALLTLGPALLVLLLWLALDALLGLLGFAFACAVLLYTLGPRDMSHRAHLLLEAMDTGNEEEAAAEAAELAGGEAPATPEARLAAAAHAVLLGHLEGVLGVIFWFLLLGPLGAVLFRLAERLHGRVGAEDSDLGAAAERLYGILLWPVVHLTAFGFAIAGSFVDALQAWRQGAGEPWHAVAAARERVVAAGLAALHLRREEGPWNPEALREVLSLTARSLVVWLVALALLTLAGLAV